MNVDKIEDEYGKGCIKEIGKVFGYIVAFAVVFSLGIIWLRSMIPPVKEKVVNHAVSDKVRLVGKWQVITIEGCEYILFANNNDYGSYAIHKENCNNKEHTKKNE